VTEVDAPQYYQKQNGETGFGGEVGAASLGDHGGEEGTAESGNSSGEGEDSQFGGDNVEAEGVVAVSESFMAKRRRPKGPRRRMSKSTPIRAKTTERKTTKTY